MSQDKWDRAFDERVKLEGFDLTRLPDSTFKPSATASYTTLAKIVMLVIATPFVIFALMFIYFLVNPEPATSVADRMQRECERQFSSQGQIIVNDCVIKLMIRWSAENQRDRMDAAYQRSR